MGQILHHRAAGLDRNHGSGQLARLRAQAHGLAYGLAELLRLCLLAEALNLRQYS
jgi:hypothetical protein